MSELHDTAVELLKIETEKLEREKNEDPDRLLEYLANFVDVTKPIDQKTRKKKNDNASMVSVDMGVDVGVEAAKF